MSSTKIAFPPPPPTVNALTAHQRAQLLRTTKKLGQVLGATPHFLDESQPLGPMRVELPYEQKQDIFSEPLEKYRSRASSIDSFSTISTTSFQTSRASSPAASMYSSNAFAELVNTTDSWRVHHPTRRPPMLRLALTAPAQPPPSNVASVKPTLETIPASPASPPPAFTLNCSRSSLPPSPPVASAPPFTIESEATRRKSKMDRLRRKLGDNVPISLVFPDDVESYSPPPNSLGETVIQIKVTRSTGQQDLGAIIESPDEHGASCSEGFGDSVCSFQTEDTKRHLPGWGRRFWGRKGD